MDVYTQVVQETQREAMSRMDRLLKRQRLQYPPQTSTPKAPAGPGRGLLLVPVDVQVTGLAEGNSRGQAVIERSSFALLVQGRMRC